jgi:hypothetical protein
VRDILEYLINANTEKLRESGTFRLLPQQARTERCEGGAESRDSEAESDLDRHVEGTQGRKVDEMLRRGHFEADVSAESEEHWECSNSSSILMTLGKTIHLKIEQMVAERP